MMNKIKKKLQTSSGETLVETLFATVIIMFTFMFMVNSIEVAVKISGLSKKFDAPFRYYSDLNSQSIEKDDAVVTISDGIAFEYTHTVPLYKIKQEDNDKEYWYYEKN